MSMRVGKERKSPLKTDVPKLYAYNECELFVQFEKLFANNFVKILQFVHNFLHPFEIILQNPFNFENRHSIRKVLLSLSFFLKAD